MESSTLFLIVLNVATVACLVFAAISVTRAIRMQAMAKATGEMQSRDAVAASESRLAEALSRAERSTRETIVSQVSSLREEHARSGIALRTDIETKLSLNHAQALERLDSARESSQQALDRIRETTQAQLSNLRQENQAKLDEMRLVVDKQLNETLQSRIGQAFEQVSKQLEQVNVQLGQVQNLASGVTDLRKTLEGVKSRGVFGEVMLEGMLEEFLHPSQVERNFKPRPRSPETVEFAIKLPNRDEHGEGDPVYLPIDAKFPKESYERLIKCLEAGDLEGAEQHRKQLLTAILSFARDIRDKYVFPPRTTGFAILYLPLESLFAEVVREPGLIERLQSECNVTLCSPTTLAAYLNALQMGFRTLAVQKQSQEIAKLLAVVRKQFQMFGMDLGKLERQLDSAKTALTRTRQRTQALDTRLKSIDAASDAEVLAELPVDSDGQLGLPEVDSDDGRQDEGDGGAAPLGIAG